MQSEFCSHTGLTSNLFCRICYCKKTEHDCSDSEDEGDENIENDTTGTDDVSEARPRGTRKRRKRKATRKKNTQGTMQDWVDRARRFMTVSVSIHSWIATVNTLLLDCRTAEQRQDIPRLNQDYELSVVGIWDNKIETDQIFPRCQR